MTAAEQAIRDDEAAKIVIICGGKMHTLPMTEQWRAAFAALPTPKGRDNG